MERNKVSAAFEQLYGAAPDAAFHSPGRVNLIGEHTDYNGGYVLPCALSFGTYGLARLRDDGTINLASVNMEKRVSVSLDSIAYDPDDDWANYPKGVIDEFQKLGLGDKLRGMDILISGNIPNGAGLSSSASLELLVCVMLSELCGCGLEMLEMVKLSQRVENNFVGVNCGIMDQYAVGMGREGQAIFLNCNHIRHEYVPLKLAGHKLVIANTNKRRGLADSKYNERRAECERALAELQRGLKAENLGQVTPEAFEAHKSLIADETIRRRAEHVVYEDARVLDAAERLRSGDIAAFGALMNASHDSLRDLYEVTGAELDALVEEARAVPGTVGSRMTGAGFGGCTVSIVRDEAVEAFRARVAEGYTRRTGLTPDFYIGETGDGAKKL